MFSGTKFGNIAPLTFGLLLRNNATERMKPLMENPSLDKEVFLR
jgi:hypothetical protein